MRSKIILLIVPPIVALAMMWFFKSQELASEGNAVLPKQSTAVSSPEEVAPKSNESKQKQNLPSIMPSAVEQSPEPEIANRTPLSAIDQIRAIKEKTALHEAVLKEHEDFTRYPPNNTHFSQSERDPVLMSYETHERSSESDDRSASITAWTDKKYLLQGETVNVLARVDDQGLQGVPNNILGQLIFNEKTPIDNFEFSDPDGDGTYQATIRTVKGSASEQALEAGIYKMLIVSSIKDLSESVSFIISPPLIQITGNYREQIDASGNLEILLEVEVQEAGRYYSRASLYTESGTPIGSAEYAAQLSAGKHMLPLTYFGRLFHDAGEAGPYQLKNIELAKTGIPMFRMPLQTSEIFTRSYSVDEFGAQRFSETNALQ